VVWRHERMLEVAKKRLLALKGHLLWKIHFYMVFEHKCVLAVCEKNHPRMIKIHPVVFLQSQ